MYYTSDRYIAIAPGATIKERLEILHMTQKEFALRMNMSEKHISHLIQGKVLLTMDVALRLESVIGMPASFWIGMEASFREALARVNNDLDLEKDVDMLPHFPYKEMVDHEWVPATRKKLDRVHHLRVFFNVARLTTVPNLPIPGIAFRETLTKSTYSDAAWAQHARLVANRMSYEEQELIGPLNIKRLRSSIPTIRRLISSHPTKWQEKLEDLFASCGIILVVAPKLKSGVMRSTAFKNAGKIVLALHPCEGDPDIFWFLLFHEIHHILKNHTAFTSPITKEDEQSAKDFAQDTLIPRASYDHFLTHHGTS